MPVANTASPKVSPSAPNDSPRKVRPSSRTSRAGAFETCSGTPYLLLRLTGRIVKGCRARPTLAAGISDPGDEPRDLSQGERITLQVRQVCDAGQLDQARTGDGRGQVDGTALGVVEVVLADHHQRRHLDRGGVLPRVDVLTALPRVGRVQRDPVHVEEELAGLTGHAAGVE